MSSSIFPLGFHTSCSFCPEGFLRGWLVLWYVSTQLSPPQRCSQTPLSKATIPRWKMEWWLWVGTCHCTPFCALWISNQVNWLLIDSNVKNQHSSPRRFLNHIPHLLFFFLRPLSVSEMTLLWVPLFAVPPPPQHPPAGSSRGRNFSGSARLMAMSRAFCPQ